MLYLTPRISLNASSSSNRVVFVSSPVDQFIQLESLKLFVDLPSLNKDLSLANNYKKVQLSIRDKSTATWELISELIFFNKGVLYREDLLTVLTSKESFRLAPNHELALNVANLGGTFGASGLLSGSDSIRLIGQAYQDSSESSDQVVQNFITATYSVPAREDWQPVSFEANWRSEANQPMKFYKDQIGRVHLQGWVERINNSVSQYKIFSLPIGYQFDGYAEFTCYQAAVGSVQINLSGDAALTGAGTTNAICLTGISFLAS